MIFMFGAFMVERSDVWRGRLSNKPAEETRLINSTIYFSSHLTIRIVQNRLIAFVLVYIELISIAPHRSIPQQREVISL